VGEGKSDGIPTVVVVVEVLLGLGLVLLLVLVVDAGDVVEELEDALAAAALGGGFVGGGGGARAAAAGAEAALGAGGGGSGGVGGELLALPRDRHGGEWRRDQRRSVGGGEWGMGNGLVEEERTGF
jgi:hypothetical protein